MFPASTSVEQSGVVEETTAVLVSVVGGHASGDIIGQTIMKTDGLQSM